MFKKLLDLLSSWPTYLNSIADNRTLSGDSGQSVGKFSTTPGRPWFIQSIGYTLNLYLKNLQTVTDRTQLNTDIANRAAIKDVNSKQGISAKRVELAQLYSFQKCFVARHKTRLQYYRDDLAQKGYRNLYALQLSYDNFANLQNKCDTPQ
jgi:hypothetical protein